MTLRLSLMLLTLAAPAAFPQPSPTPDSAKLMPDSRLFHRQDLWVLGAFTAATISMFPLDEHLASRFRDERLLTNRNLRRVADGFQYLGSSGPLIVYGSMYVVGRFAHVERAADLAVHGLEAVIVASTTAGVLKIALGRARPYVSGDTNSRSFVFGRGAKSSDFKSFPSGHSTAAFSAAAAFSSETFEWWPRTRWVIGPIMFTGATLVGLSRMYHDKHWASDVVMGAAIGTFAGLKTVRFNHTHAGNRLDRWLLGERHKGAHLRLSVGPEGSVGLMTNLNW